MSNKTDSNLFMLPSLDKRYAVGFYQELLKGIGSYKHLGNRLIHLGEQAHAFRQFNKVQEIGQLLSNFPIKDYQAIGHYFLAVAANNMGKGDQEKARQLYELAADTAPAHYKAKALLSLAAVSSNTKNRDLEMYYYLETIKAGQMNVASLEALRGITIYKAIEGYHSKAVKDLETILPIIKFAPSHIYYDYLNSFAVELSEVGRKDEARNVIKHVLSSPFIHAYPEWQETARDLKEPNRSFVAIPPMQPASVEIEASESHPPATVLSFPQLKEAPPPQKPEKLTPQEYSELTIGDKRELILAALKSGMINDDDYYKLMVMLGLVKIGSTDKILDLENDEILDDIAILWSVNVGAEELTAFLSALRDCDDSLRQRDILDRLITKIFHETRQCGISEDEWRLRVERRLPKK
jgi:hypothetical protein